MSEHAQKAFGFLGAPLPRAQGRSEAPLVTGEGTFDLPALAVDPTVESPFHLSAVLGGGPLARVAFAGGDHRGSDPELLAAEDMIVLSIVRGVRQITVERNQLSGIPHGWSELGRILRRPSADVRSRQKMTLAMTGHGQLGEVAPGVSFSLAPDEVPADVASLQARGVHDAFGSLGDELQLASAPEGLSLKNSEGTFFKRRFSA